MSIQSMIMSNNVENLQILLQMLSKNKEKNEKIDPINMCDPETGDTPLISALKVGNWNMVSLLMKYGADPMKPNVNGEVPARIKSPIRSLFIAEYLNRSLYSDKNSDNSTQSLLAVASDVLLSSLNNSFNSINRMLDSCQFNPQCAKCKLAKAIVYHTKCKHLVLCTFCLLEIKDSIICPICKSESKNKEEKEFIVTKYVILNKEAKNKDTEKNLEELIIEEEEEKD